MPDHATDRDRVLFALRTERDGGSFYDSARKHASHKLARAAFELLAREEERHVELIDALARSLDGEEEAIAVDSPTRAGLEFSLKTIYEDASEGGGDLDPAEAYAKAIDLENRISALYFEYARECDSDEAKRLFDVLYREEQDHLSLLEDMLAYLTKPDQWFIDRDGIMLDGG